MPAIIYVQPDGTEQAVDVPVGWSVMDGAVKNGVPGILAECGGSCACATCHVYVDAAWAGRLPPRADMEGDMLECTAEPATERSRLSCQVRVTPELAGLRVEVPASQA